MSLETYNVRISIRTSKSSEKIMIQMINSFEWIRSKHIFILFLPSLKLHLTCSLGIYPYCSIICIMYLYQHDFKIIKQVLLHDFNACIYKSYNLKLIKLMVAISFLIVKSYILKHHKYYSTVLLRNFHTEFFPRPFFKHPERIHCVFNILYSYVEEQIFEAFHRCNCR